MINVCVCFVFPNTLPYSETHRHTLHTTASIPPPVSSAWHGATRIRASMCHQNEQGEYMQSTQSKVYPPGARQPIIAVPVCVASQQEAKLVLVSSQSPAEWLISHLDWRGDWMVMSPTTCLRGLCTADKECFIRGRHWHAVSWLLCKCATLNRTIITFISVTHKAFSVCLGNRFGLADQTWCWGRGGPSPCIIRASEPNGEALLQSAMWLPVLAVLEADVCVRLDCRRPTKFHWETWKQMQNMKSMSSNQPTCLCGPHGDFATTRLEVGMGLEWSRSN